MIKQQQSVVVIKGGRRGNHKGDDHHGGSWKVAFADFAIAMMALFMVLWIVEAASQEEREQIEAALQSSDVFDAISSPFVVDFGGRSTPIEDATKMDTNGQSVNQEIPEGEVDPNAGQGKELNSMLEGQHLDTAQLMALAEEMQKMVQDLSANNNLIVEVVPQGLRLQIQDSKNRSMFPRGSAEMTPFFEDMLFHLTPMLAKIKNRLVISGHTDTTGYRSNAFSNWELSGLRAMAARQFMVDAGLPQHNVLQVAAMADRMLVDSENPTSGKNRRIEIMVLTEQADTQLQMLFGHDRNDNNAMQKARQFAEYNQPVSRLDVMVN